jgi:predicted LPLAT superfamily acyltransferase
MMHRMASAREEWATRRERGALPLIRLMVWIALRVGRPAAQLLMLPVCAYFFLFSPRARAASLAYLGRVLDHAPTAADRWRHYCSFAICLLDRVLLLNGHVRLFDVTVHGEELVNAIRQRGGGGFLFGAHLGSFEVVRAVGRHVADLRPSLVMYEDNARKTNAVLNAINPALTIDIIGLGKPGSMLAVRDRLDDGGVAGILADRSLETERRLRCRFLGSDAWFPAGPFRMAMMLGRPVLLMLGLYRGGNRYDIIFETISDDPANATIEALIGHYVTRLEHHCRSAPYNWFNFYDFWA